MIHIQVRLFGPAVDWVGGVSLEYALVPPARLSTLREMLSARYPRLAAGERGVRFAVNMEYVNEDCALREGDEVAVIPPVAGGQDEYVRLTRGSIEVKLLAELVSHPTCGGIATFEGVVRAEGTADNPLLALEYSAYEEMALAEMRKLRDEAKRRFAVHEVVIVHRLGRMTVGECSVAILVGAPHRGDAFEACRWVIDALKQQAPIWKREIWKQGEPTWVDPEKE